MTLTEFAKIMGVSIQYISDIKHRRWGVGMSKKNALIAAKETGISELKWLYPDVYGSPWGELEKIKDKKEIA